jgi:hypothetical protein
MRKFSARVLQPFDHHSFACDWLENALAGVRQHPLAAAVEAEGDMHRAPDAQATAKVLLKKQKFVAFGPQTEWESKVEGPASQA